MWNLGEQRLRAAQGVAAEGEEQAAGRLGVDGLAAPQGGIQLQDRAVLAGERGKERGAALREDARLQRVQVLQEEERGNTMDKGTKGRP